MLTIYGFCLRIFHGLVGVLRVSVTIQHDDRRRLTQFRLIRAQKRINNHSKLMLTIKLQILYVISYHLE